MTRTTGEADFPALFTDAPTQFLPARLFDRHFHLGKNTSHDKLVTS
jgi:hypothetical protein